MLCLYCDAWSYGARVWGSMSVLSCIYCVLCASSGSFNDAFCLTCSLLMLVEDGRGILQS